MKRKAADVVVPPPKRARDDVTQVVHAATSGPEITEEAKTSKLQQ